MTKIGILYICTGKYAVFWDRFYKNSEKYFFTENEFEKHYFVFTDDSKIKSNENIHVYYKESEGFPLDSLKRFELFLSIKIDLIKMDFIYFLNANMDFVDFVGKEIIPKAEYSGLVGVLHPGYYKSKKEALPYERNSLSTAFIPYKKNYLYRYFMGGFNGGKTIDFLELCNVCFENIKIDESNNIMACFHDESHINAYFFDKNILILSSRYGFAEDTKHSFKPKVVILDKVKNYGAFFKKDYADPFQNESPFKKENWLYRLIKKIKK